MAWRIVKQPNGLLARFSDIVDNFTHMDMTEAEAFEVCREYLGVEDARRKVLAGVEDHVPYTNCELGSGHDRWDDAIARVDAVHGKEAVEQCLHPTVIHGGENPNNLVDPSSTNARELGGG